MNDSRHLRVLFLISGLLFLNSCSNTYERNGREYTTFTVQNSKADAKLDSMVEKGWLVESYKSLSGPENFTTYTMIKKN